MFGDDSGAENQRGDIVCVQERDRKIDSRSGDRTLAVEIGIRASEIDKARILCSLKARTTQQQ